MDSVDIWFVWKVVNYRDKVARQDSCVERGVGYPTDFFNGRVVTFPAKHGEEKCVKNCWFGG